MMKNKILLFIVLILLTAGHGYAQKKKEKTQKPEGPKVEDKPLVSPPVKVTTVEGITEYRLGNGLRVLMFPDQSKQTITVNITYMVGSKHENYGETGMAHLLEHLVFKGTPKHTDIPKELTAHGARPNGSTFVDRTNYFETFNATDENLQWALDLESDRMINSYIARKDLDSEMTVVRNEFESGENNPFRVLFQRTMAASFDWHNYGKSTIGARSDIENVSIERLQAFYRKYYQPDNATLVVAGKFDEAKTLDLVNQKFGIIPKPAREILPFYTVDPTQDGERTVTVRRVGDVQMVMAAYRIPAGSHADYAPIGVLGQILGTEPSGRLYKALVDTKKASSIGTFDLPLKEPGLLFCMAEVLKDNSIEDAKATMLKTLDDLSKNPPTKEEVERAKTELTKQTELMFNSSQDVGLALSEAIATGDWRLLHLTRDRVKAVTVEDVARVATFYFKPDNRTVGLFIPTEKPDRAEIPAAPNVEELVKDYKGNQTVAQGETFDPSPANIESRTKRETLPNGVKVAMLEKKTRGESVRVTIGFRFGDEKTLPGKTTAGSFTASMLDKGTSKLTRQQIKDEFDRLKANVSIFGTSRSLNISIETTRPNLAEAITLLTSVIKDPSFPADEFEKLKNEQLAAIESQQSEPQALAPNRFQRHVNPYPKGDPRYVETFEESVASIKNVTLDEVKKFYKDFYGCTAGTTMAVVGDFDQAQIQKLITDAFGTWKSPIAYKRLENKVFPVKPLNESIETPDKANAMFIAGFNFEMKDDNPDYPAIVLGHYMLGGGFISSRLAVRIRQKDGLSYGVGSGINVAALDLSSSFSAYAIYAPENVAKLEAAFMEEINKVVTDGFTAEEIAAAKSGWLQQRTVTRAQDQSLAAALSNNLFLNRTLTFDERVEKEVSELTPEKINAAMKKYLDPTKISIVKAGDFAKAKAKTEEKK